MQIMSLLSGWLYTYLNIEQRIYIKIKQTIKHNTLENKELPERKIGEKNRIGLSLSMVLHTVSTNYHTSHLED